MYLINWKDGGVKEMMRDFEIKDDDLAGAEVLLASYGCGSYCGDAFVLFRKDGQLYEVNGSHCSCYGLEGNWSPSPVTVEELKHRLEKGELGKDDYYDNKFDDELKEIVAEL